MERTKRVHGYELGMWQGNVFDTVPFLHDALFYLQCIATSQKASSRVNLNTCDFDIELNLTPLPFFLDFKRFAFPSSITVVLGNCICVSKLDWTIGRLRTSYNSIQS